MKITRRFFLKSGTSALTMSAGLLLMPQISKGQSGQSLKSTNAVKSLDSSVSLASRLNKTDFANQIGTRFNLYSETHGSIDVSLINVEDLAKYENKSTKRKTEGFSLLFKGEKGQTVTQDVYSVHHKTLGSYSLLLVPVLESKSNQVICYEAIINRLV